jgi:hypothetical protein
VDSNTGNSSPVVRADKKSLGGRVGLAHARFKVEMV